LGPIALWLGEGFKISLIQGKKGHTLGKDMCPTPLFWGVNPHISLGPWGLWRKCRGPMQGGYIWVKHHLGQAKKGGIKEATVVFHDTEYGR